MIRAERQEDQTFIDTVIQSGQAHILDWWAELSASSKQKLLDQIRQIDFEQVKYFQKLLKKKSDHRTLPHMEPVDYIALPQDESSRRSRDEAKEIGERAIRSGRTGVFTVAGGQGTRLGYNGPKGSFPCSPISNKSLFELQAERILATGEAYGVTIPWTIMTSPINDETTRSFFEKNNHFGLKSKDVLFACQRMLPALDKNGKLILNAKDHIAMSPNGHGGTFLAMRDGGVLDDADRRGVDILSYYQVDNVLIHVIDPVFIGYHIQAEAQMSSKMLKKHDPNEKVGHFGRVDGKLRVIEYSDMTEEDMKAQNPDGSLKYGAGSIGIHLISIDFVKEELRGGLTLPYHVAHKKIPILQTDGTVYEPESPNGYKFETFVFDALTDTKASVILEIRREEEFSPIKNREGSDSPATAKRDLNNYFGSWLEAAGYKIGRDSNGNVKIDIEIHPLYARTKEAFVNKVPKQLEITQQMVFNPDSE